MLKKFESFISYFDGKKAYLVGLLYVLLGILQDMNQELIMIGLSIIAGRSTIKKFEK